VWRSAKFFGVAPLSLLGFQCKSSSVPLAFTDEEEQNRSHCGLKRSVFSSKIFLSRGHTIGDLALISGWKSLEMGE
jgi:hypothetical protein